MLYDWDNTKSRNAYILFYERKGSSNNTYVNTVNAAAGNMSEENVATVGSLGQAPSQPPVATAPSPHNNNTAVPKYLNEKIWKENIAFLKNRLLYDPDYFNFLKDFVCLYNYPSVNDVTQEISDTKEMFDARMWMEQNKNILKLTKQTLFNVLDDEIDFMLLNEGALGEESESKITQEKDYVDPRTLMAYERTPEMQTIKLATLFTYEILIRMKDVTLFANWIHILRALYEKYVPACVWFLNFLTEHVSPCLPSPLLLKI